MVEFMVRLTDYDKKPLPHARCRFGDEAAVHVADDAGWVIVKVPPGTPRIALAWEPSGTSVEAPIRFHLRQDVVAPIDLGVDDECCEKRLRNLGFAGDDLEARVRDYQQTFGREQTGAVSDIRAELADWHDGGDRPGEA